jgi:type IV pilus assembly protein PilM
MPAERQQLAASAGGRQIVMIFDGLLTKIAGRSEDAIGIDIGNGSIKMAEVVEQSGKPVLKRMGIVDMPAGSIEGGNIADESLLADTLQRMASQNGFSGAKVAASVGGRSLFIREVVFPRMSENEMRQAIRWDFDRYVPFSPDQLYFDFWVIGQGASELQVKVLLVAVPKELVDSLVRVLKKAGLKPVAVDIEPLAIHRTLPDATDCMLIDCGSAVSQVTLFQNHSPVFTRSIPIGGNQFTEALMESLQVGKTEAEIIKQKAETMPASELAAIRREEMQEHLDKVFFELAGEVRRTLEYYQVQNRSVSISKVFITGGGAKTESLPEKLSRILEMPVILHDPLASMELSASFNRQYIKKVGPRMAVAAGLALRRIER